MGCPRGAPLWFGEDKILVATPQPGEQIVEGLRQAPRWSSGEFRDNTTVVLAYSVTGRRDGKDPYEAFCASTYVQNEGRWVLLAHQQTPKL